MTVYQQNMHDELRDRCVAGEQGFRDAPILPVASGFVAGIL